MDYEKKYNEALEKARKRVATEPQDHTDAILKDIFPELRESEDERIRKWLIKTIHLIGVDKDICTDQETMDKAIAYLEKQKEQKPAEWSEEDEKKITFLERLIRYNVPEGQYGWADGHKSGFITKSEAISKLKSLRPSWKPSEEQMKALEAATVRYQSTGLESLYEDLKKL